MSARDDVPAFPVSHGTGSAYYAHPGMSLRDYFAGQALVGMTASPELMAVVSSGSILDGSAFDRLAGKAYSLADAMMAERSRP